MMSTKGGERRNAFAALERTMESEGVTWTDLGDAVEHNGNGKYTEEEMQEVFQAGRAEGVDAGIKIGAARGSNGSGNGLALPKPFEMARYCQDRPNRLKDDKQREFVDDMFIITQRGKYLSPARLAYLINLYVRAGGKVEG